MVSSWCLVDRTKSNCLVHHFANDLTGSRILESPSYRLSFWSTLDLTLPLPGFADASERPVRKFFHNCWRRSGCDKFCLLSFVRCALMKEQKPQLPVDHNLPWSAARDAVSSITIPG